MKNELKLIGMIAVILFTVAVPCFTQADMPDLRGIEIIIGNWWEDYDVNNYDPHNATEERILEWRTRIQKEYNFTIREKKIASWLEMPQVAATSIMTGSPAATVFVLQSDWALSLISQNLAYPVSNSRIIDLRNPQPATYGMRPPFWNRIAINNFTFGGKTYAFCEDVNMVNAHVIFFNKRLFREAGLDPNILYDMQKNGIWTWEKFLDISRQLTRDTNNDGIIDTYAMTKDLSTDVLDAIISSNGANYVERDANGKFYNAANTPEFLEGLQFAIRLGKEGVMKPKPEGVNWDWYKAEFINGQVAMRIDETYIWYELQTMRDDWGVVMFPKGPSSKNYRVFTRENVLVIPAMFTQRQVDQILWALSLWYTPVTDDWKSLWYSTFRDTRAVDETLAIIRDTSLHITKYHTFIPRLLRGHIAWEMWYHEGDPAQLVRRVSQDWNVKIDDVNGYLDIN